MKSIFLLTNPESTCQKMNKKKGTLMVPHNYQWSRVGDSNPWPPAPKAGALPNCANSRFCYGAPEVIRTLDPLIRSQILYPAELRAHPHGGSMRIRTAGWGFAIPCLTSLAMDPWHSVGNYIKLDFKKQLFFKNFLNFFSGLKFPFWQLDDKSSNFWIYRRISL